MEGNEKEFVSLLRKLESRKDHRAASLSKKRKPSSTSQFDRELQKLGCFVNYNQSKK